MAEPTLAILLADVQREREELRRRDNELSVIESFLTARLPRESERPREPVSQPIRQVTASVPINGSASNLDTRMHPGILQREAAKIALQALGGRAHTGEIAAKMVELGYTNNGSERDLQALKASVYPAMQKSWHIFTKVGRGEWALVNKEIAVPLGETNDKGELLLSDD